MSDRRDEDGGLASPDSIPIACLNGVLLIAFCYILTTGAITTSDSPLVTARMGRLTGLGQLLYAAFNLSCFWGLHQGASQFAEGRGRILAGLGIVLNATVALGGGFAWGLVAVFAGP